MSKVSCVSSRKAPQAPPRMARAELLLFFKQSGKIVMHYAQNMVYFRSVMYCKNIMRL